jgi:hypothetical protein
MSIVSSRRPYKDDHSRQQKSDRDDTNLSVVVPIILAIEGWAGEHLRGAFKIKAPFPQCPFTLRGIVCDRHWLINVYTLIGDVKAAGK